MDIGGRAASECPIPLSCCYRVANLFLRQVLPFDHRAPLSVLLFRSLILASNSDVIACRRVSLGYGLPTDYSMIALQAKVYREEGNADDLPQVITRYIRQLLFFSLGSLIFFFLRMGFLAPEERRCSHLP